MKDAYNTDITRYHMAIKAVRSQYLLSPPIASMPTNQRSNLRCRESLLMVCDMKE